ADFGETARALRLPMNGFVSGLETGRERPGLRQSSAAFHTQAQSASRRRAEAALWRAAKAEGLGHSTTWRIVRALFRSSLAPCRFPWRPWFPSRRRLLP